MPEQVSVPPRFNPEKGADESWSNAQRADRAHGALAAYGLEDGVESAMGDLLADLMHLCDRDDLDFEAAMARARKYHAEER